MNTKVTLFFALLLYFATSTSILAQDSSIKGTVVDADSGEPLIGVNITVKNTSRGTITDFDGNFEIVAVPPVTLTFSYIGYAPTEKIVKTTEAFEVKMTEGVELAGTTITAGKLFRRTNTDSPVPIDNINAEDLLATGQPSFDKMLHYSVPSFNSTQQTVSDATAHFDPADLRGLGPSRTLVLVNGKRKSQSSLVYINDTPGKGEVGVDMKSIPASAIERIEVLRDGASAQYGSDAIAGVINVFLKDNTYTDVNVFSGITTEGDGFNAGYNLNTGFNLGKRGFMNVTTEFSQQKETNRAGEPGKDDLFGVDGSNEWIQANPALGMRVGTPNMTSGSVMFNASMPVNNVEFYSFGNLTYRKGQSYALYRAPYWVPDPHNIFHEEGTEYQGFQPTFETDILDNSIAFGARGETNGWKFDISNVSGSNTVDYTIGSTINTTLGADSKTNFNAGGYEFRSNVTNVDLGRQIGGLTFLIGTEFRTENFVANAGEEDSYYDSGVQSFPGLQPQNEIDAIRYNVGAFLDLSYDITDDFLVGGAARFESYSDFGQNFSWKFNTRYKLLEDKLTVRASISTGFRAPSLHQIYLSNVQTLVSGGTVSNQGTFNNESPIVRKLEVPQLKDETAFNITGGVAVRPISGLTLSLDYYRIAVDNRIVYSSSIASSDTTILVGQILNDANITSLKFFTNAVNTISSGIDFVANYGFNINEKSKLNVNLGLNFNNTEIDGEITTPTPISAANFDIFDRKEQSRILSARPNDKIVLGLSYQIGGFRATLNNTRFGEVTWQHGTDPDKDQTFAAKIITDLNLKYDFTDKIGLGIAANNLFNVYPDEIDTKGDVVTDLGGRFRYPWEVNQFGFNGTTVSMNLNIKL
ncbi:MAG: TonB-dependent receptor [Chitinophagales bacterium]